MKNDLGVIGGSILLIFFIIGVAYGGFRLYRWFNWEFAYQNNVRTEIVNMVKQSCLK